jgi:hypothetical protein
MRRRHQFRKVCAPDTAAAGSRRLGRTRRAGSSRKTESQAAARAGDGEQRDLRERREGGQQQCAVAEQAGRQRQRQAGSDAPQARHRFPTGAGAEVGGEILDRVVDRLANQTGAEDQGDQMQFAVDGEGHGGRRADAEGDREQAQRQWAQRPEDEVQQREHAEQRAGGDQVELAFGAPARGVGVENGSGAEQHGVWMGVPESAFGLRDGGSNTLLQRRIVG